MSRKNTNLAVVSNTNTEAPVVAKPLSKKEQRKLEAAAKEAELRAQQAAAEAAAKVVEAKKAPRTLPWSDMAPNAEKQRAPKKGKSTLTVALDMTGREGGATLAEINEGLKGLGTQNEHDAANLLRWMNRERGWGFKMDATSGKVTLVK